MDYHLYIAIGAVILFAIAALWYCRYEAKKDNLREPMEMDWDQP